MLLSAVIFATGVVVALLSMAPIVGMIVIGVGGARLSALLFNLTFVVLTVEVAIARAPPWAAALPILWFGGYAIATVLSHALTQRFLSEIDRANTGQTLAFDPATHDILILRGRDDSGAGVMLTAQELVTFYGLNRAFQRDAGERAKIRATWIEDGDCPDRSGCGTIGDRVWNRLYFGGHNSGEPMRKVPGVCLYSAERTPDMPVITVETMRINGYGGLVRGAKQEIVATDVSGHSIRLRAGWATPLTWLPQPVVAGWLDSGAAKWRTFVGFRRDSIYDKLELTRRSERVVADALGLRKERLQDRFAANFATP